MSNRPGPDSSLAERVQRLEDRFAIQDLVAEYCAAIDGRDLQRFVSLFTEDTVVHHQDEAMRIEGRAALRDYYLVRFGTYGVTFHYPHAHTVAFDGPDEAHGTVTAHAEMGVDGRFVLAAFRYSDRYRRVEGCWRFAERELACWYYMPLDELPTGIGGALRKRYKGQQLPAELPESLASYQTWRR